MILHRRSFRWLVFLIACAQSGASPIETIDFEPAAGFSPGLLNGQSTWAAASWSVAEGGVDVGATIPNKQHLQLEGPASSGERASTALPSPQAGPVYARVDFRYQGTYDFSDFFWIAFSASDGLTTTPA